MTNATANKELSTSKAAIASRARRAAAKALKDANEGVVVKAPKVATVKTAAVKAAPKARKQPTVGPKLNAAQKRTVGQLCAAIASGFLPIASFMIAHYEATVAGKGWMWLLVAAALSFSAPTLADWAQKWCGNKYKAWGFTVLLEGVMVASGIPALSFAGLAILVVINASNAWDLAARKQVAE